MKVRDLMTADPITCAPATNVAAAAQLMWEGDCGILPVVDDGRLVGVATDRDLYIAVATRNQRPSDLLVGEVATKVVITCDPEDDVQDVLAKMKRALVRRLPVVGPGARVLGMISIDDIVRVAGGRAKVRPGEVVDTLRTLAAQHHPVPRVAAT